MIQDSCHCTVCFGLNFTVVTPNNSLFVYVDVNKECIHVVAIDLSEAVAGIYHGIQRSESNNGNSSKHREVACKKKIIPFPFYYVLKGKF